MRKKPHDKWEGFNESDPIIKPFEEVWKEMDQIEPLTPSPPSPEDYKKIPSRY